MSLEIGAIYITKDMYGENKKYKKVRLLSYDIKEITYPDGQTDAFPDTVKYEILSPKRLKGKIETNDYSLFSYESKPVLRKVKCWKCSKRLDEKEMEVCEDCGWIACPDDGACGCKK